MNPAPTAFFHAANSGYAAGLIPELRKLVDLREFGSIPARFDPHAFNALIYLIGNEPADLEIYEAALKHPGIVVLNEPNLHDLIRASTKHRPEAYFREIFYEIFGQEWDPSRDTGLDITGQQPRTFSMLRRLLDRARGCIVHSRYTESAVRMKGFRWPVARIPRGSSTRKPVVVPDFISPVRPLPPPRAPPRRLLKPEDRRGGFCGRCRSRRGRSISTFPGFGGDLTGLETEK